METSSQLRYSLDAFIRLSRLDFPRSIFMSFHLAYASCMRVNPRWVIPAPLSGAQLIPRSTNVTYAYKFYLVSNGTRMGSHFIQANQHPNWRVPARVPDYGAHIYQLSISGSYFFSIHFQWCHGSITEWFLNVLSIHLRVHEITYKRLTSGLLVLVWVNISVYVHIHGWVWYLGSRGTSLVHPVA